MSIFGQFYHKKPPLRAVVDVGSYSIKAIVFEGPLQPHATPKVVQKTVARLPTHFRRDGGVEIPSGSAASSKRVVKELRGLLFGLVKNFERIPERITIALGPSLAKLSLPTWTLRFEGSEKVLTRRDLSLHFYNLLAQHRDWKQMIIPYPLALTQNGYLLRKKLQPAGWQQCPTSCLEVGDFSRMPVRGELGFQTLILTLEENLGNDLVFLKKSLGGMPIEFVPLPATHIEGILAPLSLHDVLLVDIGGDYTTLSYFQDGLIKQISAFPVGGHFMNNIVEATSDLPQGADAVKKNYVKGLLPGRQAEKAGSPSHPGSHGWKVVGPSAIFGGRVEEWSFRREANRDGSPTRKGGEGSLILESSKIWERYFLEALKNFYHLGPLSEKVLVFGGGAHIPEVVEIIRRGDWFKELSYLDSPRVRILGAQNLFVGDSLGGFLQGPEETGLASLLIYSMHHEPLF